MPTAPTLPFVISDVFAERRYAGNQLATLLDAGALSGDEMQRIARELNFSETTFVLARQEGPGGYPVRIFTPGSEVDFAGHPTLGTACVIRRHLQGGVGSTVRLALKVGTVPVTFSAGADPVPWMRQVPPRIGAQVAAEQLAPLLGLTPADIDTRWPIEEISTGLHHLIVPLRSMAVLQRVVIDRARYDAYVAAAWARVVLVFAPGGHEPPQRLGVRVFPIALGIAEDPATGSGNGCLAAYLVRHRYFGSDRVDLTAGQGYALGRPSSLHLKAHEDAGEIVVEVGGRVIEIAHGEWQPEGARGA